MAHVTLQVVLVLPTPMLCRVRSAVAPDGADEASDLNHRRGRGLGHYVGQRGIVRPRDIEAIGLPHVVQVRCTMDAGKCRIVPHCLNGY